MEHEDESIIRMPETAQDVADEEAAFNAAFAEGRGEEVTESVESQEPAADAPDVAKPAPAPATEEVKPAPEAEVTPAATGRLIAGLTDEQIGAALARTGNLQSTVDKMAGRMGQLMQQLEALKKTPPTTVQAQNALDLKLEKLTAAFPELAAVLKEDLASLGGGGAQVAAAPPAGITQEQLDAMFAERLSANSNTTKELIETRVLSVIHPDWNDVIREPSFALYRDNVLPDGVGKQLMESEDASFIATHLTGYKGWKLAQAKPAEPAGVAGKPVVSRRLTNAVLPAGTRSAPTGPITEEDAFNAAFKQEQSRRGM